MAFNATEQKAIDTIKELKTSNPEPNMAIADQMVGILEAAGLAEEKTYSLDSIGTHPQNRMWVKLEAHSVHSLLDKITKGNVGWSLKQLRSPRAFERADGDLGEWQLKENIDLVESAGGLLAPVSKHMRIITVTCSHTVAGVRAVVHGCKSPLVALCDDKGCLSAKKVYERCPSYAEPCNNSVPFCVIDKRVERAIPDLPGYISEAGNGGHGVEQKQTQLQTFFEIHRRVKGNGGKTDDATFDLMAKSIETSKQHLEGQVKNLALYVKNFAGGLEDPLFLKELQQFSASLPFHRQIPHQVLGRFAASKLKSKGLYVNACLKAMLASPPAFVDKQGVSTLLSTTDVADMQDPKKKKAKVAEACDNIEASVLFRVKWVSSLPAPLNEAIKASDRLLSDFAINLVMLVHGKKAPGRKQYKSFDQIRSDFMREFNALCPALLQHGETAQMWPIIEEDDAAPQPKAKGTAQPKAKAMAAEGIINYADLKAEAVKRGFAAGGKISNKSTKEEIVILNLTSDTAELEGGTQVKSADLIDEYKAVEVVAPTIEEFQLVPGTGNPHRFSSKTC